MEKQDLRRDYIDLLIKIYGEDVVDFYIKPNLNLISSKEEIEKFSKEYIRFKVLNQDKNSQNTKLELKGCGKCISANQMVLEQDFPGWIGELKTIKYILIGLEIADSIRTHSHIAYNYYSEDSMDKGIKEFFEIMESIFPDIKDHAYITDIAKCNSNNHAVTRKNCINYLKEEIRIINSMNPEVKKIIIVQGISEAWDRIKKRLNGMELEDNLKLNNNNLLKLGYVYIDSDVKLPTLIFPHTTRQNNSQWNDIKSNMDKIKDNIKHFLSELSF